ncbi:MAG: LamG-like jellyroll fold domain-containing protein [Bacteroidia bacterium]
MNIYDKKYILSFNGTDNYIDFGKNDAFRLTNALSIEMWVKPAITPDLQLTILSHGYQDFEPQIQHKLFVMESNWEYAGKTPLVANKWVHLAATFDVNLLRDNFKLYINGDLDATATRTQPLFFNPDFPLFIGKRPDWAAGLFVGDIASVSLWNQARSPWEVKQSMHTAPLPDAPGLVAFWKLDEGEGDVIKDLSVNQLHGKLMGMPFWREVSPQKRHDHTMRKAQMLEIRPATREVSAPAPDLSKASISGRNGEMAKLISRVKQYNDSQIQQKQIETSKQKDVARELAAQRISSAHQQAAQMVNSTRFDYLYYLSRGKISRINPKGIVDYNLTSLHKTTLNVDARLLWQNTGVNIKAGDNVTIRYISGIWSVSPLASNLTADGTNQFIAKPHYAMGGVPEGALIGRIGNNVFLAGSNITFTATVSGELQLISNDDISGEFGVGYADNSGSITVEISTPGAVDDQHYYAADLVLDQQTRSLYIAGSLLPFQIKVAKEDGTNFRSLYNLTAAPVSLAIDTQNQQLYWIQGNGQLMQGKTDGSSLKQILDIPAAYLKTYWQLDIDQPRQNLYFTRNEGIWCVDTNGNNLRLIIDQTNAPYPVDILVDSESNHIYWLDKELKLLRRADMDGGHITDLYHVSNPEKGLAMDYVAPAQNGEKNSQLKEIYWAAREEKLTALTPGLVAHFPLDRTEAAVIPNAVNMHMVANLYAPDWVSTQDARFQGFSDTALTFDGKETYFTIADQPALRIQNYTIELWIKPFKKALGNQSANDSMLKNQDVIPEWQGIIGKPGRNFNIWLHSNGYIHHRFAINGNANHGAPDTPHGSIEWNQWNHIAITNDGTTANTYINGELKASGPVGGQLLASNEPLIAGSNLDSLSNTHNRFRGEMNEIRIWNNARSAETIQANMLKYHQHYALRGSVDGSGHLEHLFDLPSEGGLCISSKQSLAHEQRALAFRTLKQNQTLAQNQIQSKQTEQTARIQGKQIELNTTRVQKHQEITDKQAEQMKVRAENQIKLNQSKNDSNKKISDAQQSAINKRQQAQAQAATMKDNANAKSLKMKTDAQSKRDAARIERDKY